MKFLISESVIHYYCFVTSLWFLFQFFKANESSRSYAFLNKLWFYPGIAMIVNLGYIVFYGIKISWWQSIIIFFAAMIFTVIVETFVNMIVKALNLADLFAIVFSILLIYFGYQMFALI